MGCPAHVKLLTCFFILVTLILDVAVALQTPLLQSDNAQDFPLSTSASTELLALHRKLIEIESVTGNEKRIGQWLDSYLQDHGFTVERQHVSKDRFNVFAYPGKSRETKILVTSHIDTVPPFIPYELKNGNEIWGRGSVDDKACVAAQIMAVLDILNNSKTKESPSVSLLFVVGEETDGIGMKYFSSHKPTNYSAVVFGEPTEHKLAAGHKGLLSFTLNVKGRAAHSGYPWLGLSATDVLIEALTALRQLEPQLLTSPELGNTTINIGKIQGGVASNVVAAEAAAEIAIRIAAGKPETIIDRIEDAFSSIRSKAVRDGGEFEISYRQGAYGPVHLDTDLEGFETDGVNYGTDVPNLHGDHKKYLYGPGTIHVAHGPNEHLTVQDLEDAVKSYKHIIKQLLAQ